MATKQKPTKNQQKLEAQEKEQARRNTDLVAMRLNDEWRYADQGLEKLRPLWRDNEKLFYNEEKGALAEETAKSNVNDTHLSTAVIQRTQRIMAQPPSGSVKATDRHDRGKQMLMQIILDRYVKPNANAQFSHTTKLKLWTIYSQVYGSMPALVDYRVSDDYIGPDFWLIPIDQYYPQPGVTAPNDMDYCFVDSFVSLDWLAKRPSGEEFGWSNIDELITRVKEKEGKAKYSYDYQTFAESKWGGIDYGGKGRFARVLLRTKYCRDRWYTYAPDFMDVGLIRDIENPHDNNKLPIVVKQTIPLMDRAAGLGDIERGGPTQKAMNSLINLYMDTVKMSLFPPMIVNKSGVVPSSMRWTPGAFWNETTPNSIRQLQLSPQGTNTFQSVAGFLIANLNNMMGTSDMSVQKDVDPALGKTPQAIKMQAARESAADNWERDSLEEALGELYDRFVDLIAKKAEKPIDLELFKGEIEEIEALYPDVVELFEDDNGGKITIKPDMLKGSYTFTIDPGSTLMRDQAMQNQEIMSVITMLLNTTNPQTGVSMLAEAMRKKGKDIDLAELVKGFITTSNLPNKDKIVVDYIEPQPAPEMGMPGGADPMAQQTVDPMTGQPVPQQMGQQGGQEGFNDPDIQAMAEQLMGGGQGVGF